MSRSRRGKRGDGRGLSGKNGINFFFGKFEGIIFEGWVGWTWVAGEGKRGDTLMFPSMSFLTGVKAIEPNKSEEESILGAWRANVTCNGTKERG